MSPFAAPVTSPDAQVAAARTRAGLLDLSDRGVMSLVGPDARRFCNGMFTNNVRDVPVGVARASAMVDDKARIQGLLDLWCVEAASFLAVLEGVTPEAFEARYGKYIIFDDVELTDQSGELGLVGVQGPEAAAVLGRAGLPTPGEEGRFEPAGDWRVLRRARSVAGGFDLLGPRAALPALAARLAEAGAEPLGGEAAERLRVEAGLARWPVDMGERSLPHELRLVERMCSFEKGCYIGQEVINRIDVMGQVQKKLWGLELAQVPPAQTPVLHEGAAVGHTLSGVVEGGGARVLAILRKAVWEPGLVVEVEGVGPAVVRDLPFPPS